MTYQDLQLSFMVLKKSHIKELYPMISVGVMNAMMDAGIPLEAISLYGKTTTSYHLIKRRTELWLPD